MAEPEGKKKIAKAKKPKDPPETLKGPCGDEVARYGLSKRRLEVARCYNCMGKVKVSAGILLRVARTETIVICGKCLGDPGHPEEKPYDAELEDAL